MIEADAEKLIVGFKEANKSLRRRAITIGVLMILTVGLVYMESIRYSTIVDLLNYQYRLEKINELPDSTFKAVINGNDAEYFPVLDHCSSCLGHRQLFEKIKVSAYDRKLMVEAIGEIDVRMEDTNKEKSITILGFSISIKPMYYLFFAIMLILFHDFTQIIIYRKIIHRRIRAKKLPHWMLGFELFGFYGEPNKSSLKFVKFTSDLITTLFIICPLATGIMMMNLVRGGSTEILTILNFTCLVFIITDTIIIFYSENIWGFRVISNLLLGNYRISKFSLQKSWLMISSALAFLYFLITLCDFNGSIAAKLGFFVLSVTPVIGLYFVILECYDAPTKVLKGIRTSLLIINLGWLLQTSLAINPERLYSFDDVWNMVDSFSIISVIAVVISFTYVRYFFIDRNSGATLLSR